MVTENKVFLEAYVWFNDHFVTQPLSVEVTDDDELRVDLNGKEKYFIVLSRLKNAIKYAERVHSKP